MKKIILALMLLTSFAFALYPPSPYYDGLHPVHTRSTSLEGNYGEGCDRFAWADSGLSGPTWYCTTRVSGFTFREDIYVYVSTDNNSCPDGSFRNAETGFCSLNANCQAPNQIIGGECVNSNLPPPDCPSGSHADGQSCVGDYPLKASTPLESSATFSLFEDGATMYCRPNGECITTNDKGERIPNRFVNGAIPSEVSNLKDVGSWLLDKVGTGFGKVLQIAGLTMMVSGSNNVLGILTDSSSLSSPVYDFGVVSLTIGNMLVTPEDQMIQTPSGGGMEMRFLDLNTLEFVQSSSTSSPSDGSPVSSASGELIQQQITAQNAQTIWDTAGGVGKLPPNALVLGSDITYPSNNPDKAIVNTPDAVIMVKTNSDGSSTIVKVNKNDIVNTQNHNTDLPVEQEIIPAPKINPDGTTTQTPEIIQGTVAPGTNTTTNTSQTTGTPIIAPYGKGDNNTTAPVTPAPPNPDGSPNGYNINLGGVTIRLDRISNQLTKQNEFQDKIDKAVVASVEHGIPAVPSSWDSWTTTFENMKSDLSNVATQADELKSFINGEPLTLNLTGGTVTTCPFTKTLDVGVSSFDVSLDLCKSLSPARNVVYMLVYFPLVISILMFAIKIIFLMAV